MVHLQVPPFAAVRAGMLIAAVLAAQGASASVLVKRDAPLARVNIPLTVNKDQRYIVGVNMSSSPIQQTFKFALSLNTGYSAVAGIGCDSCGDVPSYNASASASQRTIPGSANVTIGSARLGGPFIKENCSLHEANGTAWQYPNQTIIVANSSSSFFSDVTSGLIGLGTNTNGQSGDFFDTIYGQWLIRNPSRNNFSFGMDLKPPKFTSDDDQGNGGVLHWIVPDSTAYEGEVSWSTASVSSGTANTPVNGTENESSTTANAMSDLQLPESDWSIQMDGWAASISGTSVASSTKSQALIEPFFTDIFFPASQAELLYAAVPSATQMNSFVNSAQAWSLPCDPTLSVTFTFSGQAFPLDQTQLIEQQTDGTCIGTIKAWPDPTVSNFMLGSNFVSALYLIYVVGRPGSGVPNSIGMAPRATNSSSNHTGAIVGGTVGGVVLIALLVLGAYILGRRHRRTQTSRNTIATSKTDEKDNKFGSSATGVVDEASDEGGAQYAVYNTLPRHGQRSPITPSTAHSAQPLLPEAQDPQSPAFSVPGTPHSPMDFLAMSSTGSHTHFHHHHSTTPEPSAHSTGSGGGGFESHISYNPHALGANMSASRGAGNGGSSYPVPMSMPIADVDSAGHTMTIEPYVLAPSSSPPAPPSNREHKLLPSGSSYSYSPPNTGSDAHAHVQFPQPHHTPNSTNGDIESPRDIDPFSPTTPSTSALTPFILAPPPRSHFPSNTIHNHNHNHNDNPKNSAVSESHSNSNSTSSMMPDTPAPPYSVHAHFPISPTLVEEEQEQGVQPEPEPAPREKM